MDAIRVELAVFDLAGRKVGVFYAGPATRGRFAVQWDGPPAAASCRRGPTSCRLTAETDRGQQQHQGLVSVIY